MAIALILLADLGIRVRDLNAMYLDTGMFPRAEIQQHYSSVWNWSLQFASRTRPLQIALFGVEALLGMGAANRLQNTPRNHRLLASACFDSEQGSSNSQCGRRSFAATIVLGHVSSPRPGLVPVAVACRSKRAIQPGSPCRRGILRGQRRNTTTNGIAVFMLRDFQNQW
jgi:hypothetical protein